MVLKKETQILRPAFTSSEWHATSESKRIQTILGSSKLITTSNMNWRDREYILNNPKFDAKTKAMIRKIDCGHDFSVDNHSYYDDAPLVHWDTSTPTIRNSFDGYIFAYRENVPALSSTWPVATPPPLGQRHAAGTSAIAKVLPKNPVSNCYVSTRELVKDGVPSVPFLHTLAERSAHFRDLAKGGGKEYLNVEFGWKPFIGDLNNVARAVANSHSILSQYERDAGRNVRRSFSYPVITTDEITNTTGFTSPPLRVGLSPPGVVGALPLEVHKHSAITQWFSGCFTYWLRRPDNIISSMGKQAQEANKLFGVEPTPDNIWKASPWSWGIDWFSNVGDILHNLCSLQGDSQVMRYGYVMTHTELQHTYTLSTMNSVLSRDLVQMFGHSIKQRDRATPYGFGLDQTLFTASRLAIIGALGISLTPGKAN